VELLSDGRVLVEDNQTAELRLFGSDGTVLGLVGGPGDGPGEFRNLTELSLTRGDTAYAYDRRLYRISSFASTGELISTVSVGRERAGAGSLALDAWALDSDHLVLLTVGPGQAGPSSGDSYQDHRDAVLHVLAADGTERAGPFVFDGGYSIRSGRSDRAALFANRPFVSVGGGTVVSGAGITYDLTLWNASLEPRHIIRWSGWERPLPDSLVQTLRSRTESALREFGAGREDTDDALAMYDPGLVPGALPALGTAVLDELGKVWVSRFVLGHERWDERDAWHVLDRAGSPLARVQLPPEARLAAVRTDRIALIVRDSLEVEHLRIFALER
jgi:hypothetical protein